MERVLQWACPEGGLVIALHASKESTMKRYVAYLLTAVAPLAAALIPTTAHAAEESLDSCGGVFLSGDASCEFHKTQECEETCKTVSVQESCTAQLYTMCEAGCSAEATTECTQTCSPTCVNDCTTTKTPVTSDDICAKDCIADCNTKCQGASSPDCCAKACPYTCNKKCKDRCHDDDEMTECAPKCTTACDGQCTSTSNTKCQVDCQTTQWEQCQTTTREVCTKSCKDKGGAIVCNGEFLNADNLKDCAAELSAKVSIDIDLDVDVNAAVHTVTKTANNAAKSTKSTFSCGVSPANAGAGSLWVVAGLGIAAMCRRRRRD
jgi:hypothetical protein